MKYTMSEDGIERATIIVKVRLSRRDIANIKEMAKKGGETWRQWIDGYANLGIEEGLLSEDGSCEQRYGRGGD